MLFESTMVHMQLVLFMLFLELILVFESLKSA